MPHPSIAPTSIGDSPAPARVDGSRRLDFRAIFRGAMVGAGGALLFSTLIGIAAVLSMASDGLSPRTIALQLRSQWDLKIALALVEFVMALLAGYSAAITAGRSRFRHAVSAGAATVAANLVIITVCGSPLPLWLAAVSISLTMPLAAFGGYLASPRTSRASPGGRGPALTSPKR